MICVNSKLGAASELLNSTYKIDGLKSKKFFQAIKTGWPRSLRDIHEHRRTEIVENFS